MNINIEIRFDHCKDTWEHGSMGWVAAVRSHEFELDTRTRELRVTCEYISTYNREIEK